MAHTIQQPEQKGKTELGRQKIIGRGVIARHQTGWTRLVAKLLQPRGEKKTSATELPAMPAPHPAKPKKSKQHVLQEA